MEDGTKATVENEVVQNDDKQGAQVLETKPSDKTFTQEDMNAVIQERLARERVKIEKELTEKMQAETKEKDFREREKTLSIKEAKWKAKEFLAEKGFCSEIADILNYESEIDLETQINYVNSAIEYAAKKQVNEMLKKSATTPKSSASSGNKGGADLRQIMGLRV